MANAIDQKINRLLRRHLAQMKIERENDSRASMRSPEKHPDAVLRAPGKIQVPQKHFPIKRPAFAEKRRLKHAPVRAITRSHESLQMVAGNQFVEHRRAAEMNIVAA